MAKKATKKKAAARKAASKSSRPAKGPASNKRDAGVRCGGDLQHRLDTLLHTMRCITQHEDELCTLLHDACRTGRVSVALRRELRSVLQELPSGDYLDDLHAVQEAVEAA